MQEFLLGALGLVGIPLLGYAISIWLPRKRTYGWGRSLGVLIRKLSFEKLGHKTGNKMLIIITNTLSDFFEGLLDGTKGENKYAK